MSCNKFSVESFADLHVALMAIALSGKLHSACKLKSFLSKLDGKNGYTDKGCTNLIRLLWIFNHRAYRNAYPNQSHEKFVKIGKLWKRAKPSNYRVNSSYELLIQAYQHIQYLTYNCEDLGELSRDQRKAFLIFDELVTVLKDIVINNTPRVSKCGWKVVDLDWYKAY